MTAITMRWRERPVGWSPAARAAGEDLFSWEIPRQGESLLAVGAVAEIETTGAQRFERAAALRAEVRTSLRIQGDAPPGAPLWVGGFAFEDEPSRAGGEWEGFPPLRFVVPRRLYLRRGDRFFEAEATGGDPGLGCAQGGVAKPAARGAPPSVRVSARASAAIDRERFALACERIRSGDLQKVVVARAWSVEAPGGFEAERILAALRSVHPDCRHYGLQRRGAVFLGATPERLLRVADERVWTDAVAGTAARGRCPEEDARLRRALALSKKEQEEHALVVQHLRNVLAEHGRDLEVPEAPKVITAGGVQHLHTPLSAQLPGGELLRLAGALHPTPAVAGSPTLEARAWLAAHEGLERGWYAGGIGWLDAAGGGEIAVALRCGLFRGERGTLFAGAGIVAASEPEAELAETRLKMRSLLDPLLEL